MILIFGGTTEGRIAAEVCDKSGKPFFYSTKTGEQKIYATNINFIYGAMDCDEIIEFCKHNGIRLIIDAAHPFAEVLHHNISQAANELGIPTIRLEREKNSEIRNSHVHWFDTLNDTIDYIKQNKLSKIVALTGVKSAVEFATIQSDCHIILRILDKDDSREILQKSGFNPQNIIYYKPNTDYRSDLEQIRNLNPSAIVTKESGEVGGFNDKLLIAKELGLPILTIRRPKLPKSSATVYGKHGLRRKIEKLLPDCFELRTGITTGSCSTAAALAALKALIEKRVNIFQILIKLPSGEPFEIDINSVSVDRDTVSVSVIKDAGDDPDITNGMEFIAKVKLNSSHKKIKIRGGEGIGRVTIDGLGIAIGDSAINKSPLMMISSNLKEFLDNHGIESGVDVEIIVPRGREIAVRTFNSRLGIVDGISILGTSGIVQPFSADAFIESIRRQVKIVKAMNYNRIVINSGAKSERHAKSYYTDVPHVAFIHYGNLIGDTIKLAVEEGIEHVALVVMIGKAVKLAAGELDTHSKKVIIDRNFLCSIAQNVNCSQETLNKIKEITTAHQLWEIISQNEKLFFESIVLRCYNVCKPLIPNSYLEVMLLNDDGEIFIIK